MSGGDGRPALELCWMPVAAGTMSRLRERSLWLWERLDAAVHRREPGALYHSALKLRIEGEAFTLEVSPAFDERSKGEQLMTGPVGLGFAGRWQTFRYQLLFAHSERLPDEKWIVGEPLALSANEADARRILELAPSAPRHVWGRRAPGTTEMWTSDSSISWLLCRAGFDEAPLAPPVGGRAPGWASGWQAARAAKPGG